MCEGVHPVFCAPLCDGDDEGSRARGTLNRSKHHTPHFPAASAAPEILMLDLVLHREKPCSPWDWGVRGWGVGRFKSIMDTVCADRHVAHTSIPILVMIALKQKGVKKLKH